MATDAPQPEVQEVRTDQPAKQPIEETLAFSIRNHAGWLTYTTDNDDAFLNEWQRRVAAGENDADLNPEGGDPEEMLRAREEAETAAQQAAREAQAEQTQRISDVRPQVLARATELAGDPKKLAKAVAKLEFRVRGLLQNGDDV